MQASSWAIDHIFVGGVGLGDVAGPADHRGAPGLLE